MSSPQASPAEVGRVAVEYLNITATSLIPAWCGALLRYLFLTVALPLFALVLAAYMVCAVNAWKDLSSGKISEAPLRYNRIRWTRLPLLARIEAVLTWNWHRPQRKT